MRRAFAAALLALALAAPVGTQTTPLEEEKLRAEIRKLELENERAESGWRTVLDLAPFLTVLVAAAGLLFPIWRESREHRRQRERELRQRFDEQFSAAIANLGSDSAALRVSAVVALENFLRSQYAEFHDQVYRVLCANLSAATDDLVSRFLVRAFADAARIAFPRAPLDEEGVATLPLPPPGSAGDGDEPPAGRREALDIAHCTAPRLDLTGLNLTGSDLDGADVAHAELPRATFLRCGLYRAKGYNVNLERARLSRSDLREIRFKRARCNEAHFHKSLLVSADLREAELAGAEFQQARLQGARFAGATLTGARFEDAVLADTHFRGAVLDDAALASIVNARERSWEKAHFDPVVKAKLDELDAARRSRADRGATSA